MAGHSHWAQVKHKKAIIDKKRSQIIGKLINAILVAARENPNPETNPKLKNAIERAKKFGIPQETIERNLKKTETLKAEELTLEVYAPMGVALIIKGMTDNKNRTISEIKSILNKYSSKLAEPGSVLWLFEEKGVIEIEKENFNEMLIEKLQSLLEDFEEKEKSVILYTSVNNLYKTKEILENSNIKVLSTEIQFVPKSYVNIENKEVLEKINNFIDELLDHNDVYEVFSNLR